MNYFIKQLAVTFFIYLFLVPHSAIAQEVPAQESTVTAEDSPENWTIENIECAGNEITSCSIIENDLYLRAGDKVNEEEIENARLRLKTLGLFYDVQIHLKKGSARGQVIVVIQVTERSASYINLSSDLLTHGSSGGIAVGNRNLFGLGKRLEASYSDDFGASNKRLSVTYEDPNLFGSSKYFSSVGVFRQLLHGGLYESETLGYSASVGRRIFDFSYFKIGVQGGNTTRRSDNSIEYTKHYEAGTLEYGWDTRDDIYFPNSGSAFALGTIFGENFQTYYQSSNFTTNITGNYYFNLLQNLIHTRVDGFSDSSVSLGLTPTIARYFTFARQGSSVPDRMKIFVGPGITQWSDSDRPTLNAKLGISYVIDSFGTLDLSLTQDIQWN